MRRHENDKTQTVRLNIRQSRIVPPGLAIVSRSTGQRVSQSSGKVPAATPLAKSSESYAPIATVIPSVVSARLARGGARVDVDLNVGQLKDAASARELD